MDFLTTGNKFTRYIIDRRLKKGLEVLKKRFKQEDLYNWSVLIVCGGVGGEGIFFLKNGFKNVTNSDFSENAIGIAKTLDPRLKTLVLNGESLSLKDETYDLVVVRDGLHHLPRPVLGFTEMIRVAKKAIIVVEPYDSMVGNIIGTEWEGHEGALNYVFRWNKSLVNQVVKSYMLKRFETIKVLRFWDHNVMMSKLSSFLPEKFKYYFVRSLYLLLSSIDFLGNMMVAIVIK